MLFDCVDVERRFLIDEIVEPVGKEQVGMSAPAHQWVVGRIVVAVVVARNLDGKAFCYVAFVFGVQRQRRIF